LVYERKSEVKGQAAQSRDAKSEIGSISGGHQTHRRWSGNVKSAFDCVEDDILHDKMVSEITIPNNPLQLAFIESVGGIYNA
jgi:hypothetical protein